MLKVMTLNLWRYHDWDNRKDNIHKLLTREIPEVVAFQEVLTNHAFSDTSAASDIADACDYKYRAFAPHLVRNNSKDRDGNRTQRASEGQAFISKYPFLETEVYYLDYHEEYPEEVAVLFCTIDKDGEPVEFCNVHFANNDVSKLNFKELLDLIERRGTHPLILGDFNIFSQDMKELTKTLMKDYVVSSEVENYISYKDDNDTLDYVAVPKTKYSFENVKCPDDYVSDHCALIASIKSQ